MPWIDIIPHARAQGLLKQEYDAVVQRVGRVWNIVSIMSRNPPALKSAMDLYGLLMQGRSPLSRGRREMIAVVVSATNRCVYCLRGHAQGLRAHAGDFGIEDEDEADRFVHLVASDWRRASLGEADRALCAFAEKLSREPETMSKDDVDELRRHGFDDDAVHDAAQVASAFNYYNRIAQGLGIELEPLPEWELPPAERRAAPEGMELAAST